MRAGLYIAVAPTPDRPSLDLHGQWCDCPDNDAYINNIYRARYETVVQREHALSLLSRLILTAGGDPTQLTLHRDKEKRPYCLQRDGSPVNFDFNLSHTDFHVACALLVDGGHVGIDIEEPLRDKPAAAMLARYGSTEEKQIAAELTAPSKPNASPMPVGLVFPLIWTAKEAISKQNGRGRPLTFNSAHIPQGCRLRHGILTDGSDATVCLCVPESVTIPTTEGVEWCLDGFQSI